MNKIGDRLLSRILPYVARPTRGRKPDDAIVRLTKKRAGRRLVVAFLDHFYENNLYKGLGPIDGRTLGDVFSFAEKQFVKGNTSHPSCKRK